MIALGQVFPNRDSRSVDDPFRDLNSINDKLTASASKNTDIPQNG